MRRLLILVVAALVVAAGIGWHPWHRGLPGDAAFAVGDKVVTVADLDKRNESLRALYGVEEPLAAKKRAEFRREAAKSMAISMVLDRAVKKASITVPDAEIDKAFAGYLDAQFDGDRQAFLDALGNVNTSEVAVRAEIRRQLALRLLLARIAGKPDISDAAVRAAFTERRTQLGSAQKRVVSNIVVATRRDAVAVRGRLDRGADVAALAHEVSIDAATRDSGGRLGAVTRNDLLPAVAAVVFATGAGQAYGPVRGTQGWNVGVVTRVIPPVPATYAAVRTGLRATLEAERAEQVWTSWLQRQLRRAHIEYAERYRPADPDEVTDWQQTTGATEAER